MTRKEALEYINNMWMSGETHDALETLIPEFGKTCSDKAIDYEEKYKEALLEARAVLEPCLKYSNGKVREALDSIDKELKSFESEDERIRKEIVSIVQSYRDSCISEGSHRFDDCLAWLEKQKPSAPNDYDEKMRKKIIDHLESIKMGCVICTIDTSEEIAWLEKTKYELAHEEELLTKRQKELSEIRALKDKEQKPAEYLSKEKVFAIMKKLTSLSFCVPLGSDEKKQIDEITRDVRSLLDYPIEQKQEWSGEDEKILDSLIRLYSIEYSEYVCPWANCTFTYGDVVNFLKSLRPAWKPSEEQMTMLRAVLNDPNNAGAESCQLALSGLYKQLKKL